MLEYNITEYRLHDSKMILMLFESQIYHDIWIKFFYETIDCYLNHTIIY